MSFVLSVLALLLHAALLIGVAPLAGGLVGIVRARLGGRAGAGLMQPWRDLARLLRKQPVVAEQASFVTSGAPVVVLAATMVAGLLVPSFALGMAGGSAADLLVVAGLLATARVGLALAAMDAGSGMGGLGASRTMLVGVLAEPGLLLVVLVFVGLAGSSDLEVIAGVLREGGGRSVSIGLAAAAMLPLALIANARMPVQDQAGGGEPAMAQAAMMLEYSGWHLAAIEFAGSVRLLIWIGLLGALFSPQLLAGAGSGPFVWVLAIIGWGLRVVVACVALGGFEMLVVRVRPARVPHFIGAALLLGVLAVIFLFVGAAGA